MVRRKFKSGLATVIFLCATILVVVCWPQDEKNEYQAPQIRKIIVRYELGTKEIEINDYIFGVMSNFKNWIKIDNPEMIKILAVYVRTNIAYVMKNNFIMEVENLPFKYTGNNTSFSKELADFVRENINNTNGVILEDENGYISCQIDFERVYDMTKKGKLFNEILMELFPQNTIIIDFL